MSKVGIIEFDKLVIGNYLMKSNDHLREWSCPLPKLTHGNYMFYNCTALTSFDSNLLSLTNGGAMFYNTSLASFTSNLSSLIDGYYMFANSALTSFDSVLSSLTNGYNMFYNCSNLTTFDSDLSKLTTGSGMFEGCSNLTSFVLGLPYLKIASNMFNVSGEDIDDENGLNSFESFSPLLENGVGMFRGQKNLSTVAFYTDMSHSDDGNCFYLPALKYGDMMFAGCKNLEIQVTNTKDFSSLETASYMFAGTHFRGGGNFVLFLSNLENLPGSSMNGEIHLTVEFMSGTGDSSYFYNQATEPGGEGGPTTMDDMSDEYPSYNHDKDPTAQEWLTRYVGGWTVHVNKY